MCNCKAKKNYNKQYKVNWCSVCFEVSEPKSYNKVFKRIFMGLFLFLLVFTFVDASSPKISHITLYRPFIEKDIPLNDSAITSFLVKNKCVLPNIAIAQFRIESSHYTSKIAIENNNIAGIRTSKSKYVIGYKYDHCVYKNIKDCLLDYLDIQNYYLKNINGKYAESKLYIPLIKKM